MSKERAQRRAEREREAGIKQAARAAEQERRERKTARRDALRRTGSKLGLVSRNRVARPTGSLAAKRRRQLDDRLRAYDRPARIGPPIRERIVVRVR